MRTRSVFHLFRCGSRTGNGSEDGFNASGQAQRFRKRAIRRHPVSIEPVVTSHFLRSDSVPGHRASIFFHLTPSDHA